jgi:hypothetical protein
MIAVVDQFVANVGGDTRINGFFQATVANAAPLSDQICEASGGPCHYTGKDMAWLTIFRQFSQMPEPFRMRRGGKLLILQGLIASGRRMQPSIA